MDERIGENIEDAVKAELLEEAGLIANKIEIEARKTLLFFLFTVQ